MSRPRMRSAVLLVVIASLLSCACARSSAAAAPGEKKPMPAVAAATPVAAPLKPGEIAYTAEKGEPVSAVVHRYLAQSSLMTAAEFEQAIRGTNSLGKAVFLKKGQQIT